MKGKQLIFPVLMVLAVTFGAYLPSLNNGFTNYDDPSYITENPLIRDSSSQGIKNIFTDFYCAHYHPVTLVSLSIEYHFFGAAPRIYHATNLLLHLLNCLLVFQLILLLCGGTAPAFIAAMLFGIHPLGVESVAWISERKNVLYAFFFLAAAIEYIRYGKNGLMRHYVSALVLFSLSLLSKATALTLPAVLILIDIFQNRKSDKKAFLDKIPFFALSAAAATATFAAQNKAGATTAGPLFQLLTFYMGKIVLPTGLSCLYPYNEMAKKFGGGLPYSFAAAAIVAAGVIWSAKYTRNAVFGSLFFLITIFPVTAALPIGPAMAADRYTYVPAIGLFYIAGIFITWLYQVKLKNRKAAAIAVFMAAIAVIAALFFQTRKRCLVWRDSAAVWEDVLEKYPGSRFAINNLAAAHLADGNNEKGISLLNRLTALSPGDADAYYNLGTAYGAAGKFADAAVALKKALETDPAHARALNNLGNIYFQSGKKELALSLFNKSISADRGYAPAYYNAGNFYLEKGDYENSAALFIKAAEKDPHFIKAYDSTGFALIKSGQIQKAIDLLTKALKAAPDDAAANYNLSVAYYLKKNYQLSHKHYDAALSLGFIPEPRFAKKMRPRKK